MSVDPWNPRVVAGLAALAVFAGLTFAYCDNRGQEQTPADPCAGVAYAVPARPAPGKTSSGSRKNGDRPPARTSKKPRPTATAPAQPSPSKPASHRPRHEFDLDGC
ncbi:hypothetical protein ABZ499_33120 [Streptomyces sp. NPDC019990]|uniref:hypothetical protein n=1 Tax=Streptomyces sp. NPDC019990 TaxID=3154693 RepID=UPI0033F10F8B